MGTHDPPPGKTHEPSLSNASRSLLPGVRKLPQKKQGFVEANQRSSVGESLLAKTRQQFSDAGCVVGSKVAAILFELTKLAIARAGGDAVLG